MHWESLACICSIRSKALSLSILSLSTVWLASLLEKLTIFALMISFSADTSAFSFSFIQNSSTSIFLFFTSTDFCCWFSLALRSWFSHTS